MNLQLVPPMEDVMQRVKPDPKYRVSTAVILHKQVIAAHILVGFIRATLASLVVPVVEVLQYIVMQTVRQQVPLPVGRVEPVNNAQTCSSR